MKYLDVVKAILSNNKNVAQIIIVAVAAVAGAIVTDKFMSTPANTVEIIDSVEVQS